MGGNIAIVFVWKRSSTHKKMASSGIVLILKSLHYTFETHFSVTSGLAGQAAGRAWKSEYSMVLKQDYIFLYAKKQRGPGLYKPRQDGMTLFV